MNNYVYQYFDTSRNEAIYIGKGTGKRAWYHLRRTDMHPFVQRLQKMIREGVEPVITFLCDGVDSELADLVECEAIAKIGRKDLGKGPLLNLTDGGDGLCSPSQDVRNKIGAASRLRKPDSKETRLKKGWSKGKSRTPLREDTKALLSSKAIARGQLSLQHKAAISASQNKPCTVDGVTIYESRKALKAALGQGRDGIYHPNFRYV